MLKKKYAKRIVPAGVVTSPAGDDVSLPIVESDLALQDCCQKGAKWMKMSSDGRSIKKFG